MRAAKTTTWASWGLIFAFLVGGLVLTVMNRSTVDFSTASLYAIFWLSAVSSAVGGLIARRHPSNPIGWPVIPWERVVRVGSSVVVRG